MSYYLRVLDPKERGNITHDICSIHSTLSDAIDALSNVEEGTFVSLTTKRPRIKKCLSCDTRKAHDYLLDENIQLREALENIKEKAVLKESEASNATYGFAYEIEELARDALKGGKE